MNTKTVKFKKQKFDVPLWANYIVSDDDGTVCAFSDLPIYDYGKYYNKVGTEVIVVGNLKYKSEIKFIGEVKLNKI